MLVSTILLYGWLYQIIFCCQLLLGHVQSLPKVLEHLQYLLDCLVNIPLSPQNNVDLWKIYTQHTRQFTCR